MNNSGLINITENNNTNSNENNTNNIHNNNTNNIHNNNIDNNNININENIDNNTNSKEKINNIDKNNNDDNIDSDNVKNTLVISGGGTKGFVVLGALQKLYDNKKLNNIKTYCGTSVGAIISLLLLIEYAPIDVHNILMAIDFEMLMESTIDSVLDDNCFGIYTAEKIYYIVGMMIKKKNISLHITFKQLYKKYNKKIIITGVCLNDISLHYFSVDNTPDMEVFMAIKITMAIPVLFKPVSYDNKIWIDGGCLNNFPIDLFDDCLENVIGIYLDSGHNNIDKFENIQDYIVQLTKCLFKNVFKINIKKYEKHIIHFNVEKNEWILNKYEKEKLYNIGYNFQQKNIL